MTDDPKCVAGCISFYGGERKHHKDCPYYAESLTKLNADRIEALEAEVSKARAEGRRVGLEEALSLTKRTEILGGQKYNYVRCEEIHALIDKPADPVVEKARKPKDHDRTMKEALFGLIGSSQEPVENPVREDISYGGVLVNTPDGPKVAYLRLSFENIAQKDGK